MKLIWKSGKGAARIHSECLLVTYFANNGLKVHPTAHLAASIALSEFTYKISDVRVIKDKGKIRYVCLFCVAANNILSTQFCVRKSSSSTVIHAANGP